MIEIDKHEDQLGVVLVWNSRPQIGRYGYVTPFRHIGRKECVFFFDEHSLANLDEPIVEGSLVHYQFDMEQGRPKVFNVRLEQFLSHDHQLDFMEDDVRNFREFRNEIQDPDGTILRFIRERFSTKDLKYLTRKPEFRHGEELRDGIDDFIAERLNAIIGGPLIYDKKRFAKITLRNRTQLLLKKNPQESDLRYLNRLLVEDAITSEITNSSPFPDCSPPVIRAKVFESGGDNETGKLKLEHGLAWFFKHYFPADSYIPKVGTKVQCRIHSIYNDASMLFAYDIWELLPHDKPAKPATTAALHGNKTPGAKLTLPLQFDWTQELLISSNKISSPPLPLRFAAVLKAFFSKNPLNPKTFTHLRYSQVAEFYIRGKIMALRPNISSLDIKTRLENQKVAEHPDIYSQEFARDLRRWLKTMGIPPKALFDCDRKSQNYYLVSSGWHQTKPVVNRSEASISFRSDAEFKTGNKHGNGLDDGGAEEFD